MTIYNLDAVTTRVFTGIFLLLTTASLIGFVLKRKIHSPNNSEVIDNLVIRIKSWWLMIFVFLLSVTVGRIGSLILFSFISFLALKEFIRLDPEIEAKEHRLLGWVYFVVLPAQYIIMGAEWYGLFSIFIPVYVFLFIPIRMAMTGDYQRFFERSSRVQWAAMVCIYFVSYAPALLTLQIPGMEGSSYKLLLFLVIVVQASDVLQYIFGKWLGKAKIAPHISPNKTIEGFIAGVAVATLLGIMLRCLTPFSVLAAAVISLLIALMGFFGGLTMSAIKRDKGIKDYGSMISGHGGMLDRIDSLCFAAPVFFHLIRFFY